MVEKKERKPRVIEITRKGKRSCWYSGGVGRQLKVSRISWMQNHYEVDYVNAPDLLKRKGAVGLVPYVDCKKIK